MSLFEPNESGEPSQAKAYQRWRGILVILAIAALIFALFFVLGTFS
jgi:hypothetical protein